MLARLDLIDEALEHRHGDARGVLLVGDGDGAQPLRQHDGEAELSLILNAVHARSQPLCQRARGEVEELLNTALLEETELG